MLFINYTLRRANPRVKSAYIQIEVSINARRHRLSTGISIAPDGWDPRRKRIKPGIIPTAQIKNQVLQDLANEIELKYWNTIKNEKRVITKEEIKHIIYSQTGRGPASLKDISLINWCYHLLDKKIEAGKVGTATAGDDEKPLSCIK